MPHSAHVFSLFFEAHARRAAAGAPTTWHHPDGVMFTGTADSPPTQLLKAAKPDNITATSTNPGSSLFDQVVNHFSGLHKSPSALNLCYM